MKDSQIRVCGRAAQTDSGAGGAVMFGCLAAAAVAGGFMTAGARLLLNASAVTSALSSVSKLLSPAVNAAACILLTIAVSALIAPLRQGMRRYFLLGALRQKRRAAECTAAFRGKRAFSALRLHIALAALNLVLWIFFLLPGAALAAGGIYMLLSSTVGILTIARRAHGEHTHAYIGLHILLRRAAGVVGGGVYSRRRSGCFDKTGSAPKPRYHARALPRFRPIQGGIYSLVSQLRINSARIFRRSVLRPVLRGVDDGDLGFQK